MTTVDVAHLPTWPDRGNVLAQAVLAAPRGGVIVVIGHASGFNSTVASVLGGQAVPETYAAMSILTLVEDDATRAVIARYGAQSTLD